VLAKIGDGGKVCVYTLASTHLVIDVNGYIGPESGTTSIVPARLLETRPGESTADGDFEGIGRRPAGSTMELKVTGRGGVSGSASAVMLNVTAVFPSALGFLTVFPCGSKRPNASNVNYGPGAVVPNAVLAKVGGDGRVCIYTLAETDLVVDVNGYVAGGSGTTSILPARLLETRRGDDNVTVDRAFEATGAQPAGSTLELDVAGRGGVPEIDVGAVMLNVTAILPSAPGFLTVYPCGSERPTASNVNYQPGQVVPNAVLARIGNGGKVCIYTLAATDLVVDVNGWYELPPNQPNSNVTVLDVDEFEFTSLGAALPDPADPLVETPEQAEIATDTSDLDVGDIVVVEKPNGEPYYGRVEQRTDETVRTEQVALAEVVPAMDVSLEADTATGEVTKNDSGDAVSDVEVSEDQKAPDEDKKKPSCEVGADFAMDVSGSANPGRFVFDVSFSLGDGLESARIGYAPIVTASATVDANVALTCGVNKTLFTKQLPTIRFVVAGVPVLVTQKIEVGVSGSVQVFGAIQRTYTLTADAFVGVVYEAGQWDRETSINLDFDQTTTSDAGIAFSLSVPAITYEARAYGIVGIDVEAGVTLRMTYRPGQQKVLSLTAAVGVGAALVIELDLTVITLRYGYSFANVTLFGPKELWSVETANTNCSNPSTGAKTTTELQCRALVEIYNTNNGSNWNDKGNWGTNSDPCDWPGVTCAGGNVTELSLVSQGMTGDLPTEIRDLSGLGVLNLRDNQLASIPSEVGELEQLRELTLGKNSLTAIPYAIGSLGNLELLDLTQNQLTSMPPSISGLRALETLNLAFNQLGMLPRTIGQLTGLTSLDARSNRLEALPPTMWGMNSLEFLDVSNNPLTTMPAGVGNLRNLTGLFWSNTEVASVPSEVGNLTKMGFLKLDGNRLTSAPSSLGSLQVLERLYLSGNSLTSPPPFLRQYSTLTHLELGFNSWNSDFTATMRDVRDENPGIVALSLGPTGCPAISDGSVVTWVEQFDVSWDNGC